MNCSAVTHSTCFFPWFYDVTQKWYHSCTLDEHKECWCSTREFLDAAAPYWIECTHTKNPTKQPTAYPTLSPIIQPTSSPVASTSTHSSSLTPSFTPSQYPSLNPTHYPSFDPTKDPLILETTQLLNEGEVIEDTKSTIIIGNVNSKVNNGISDAVFAIIIVLSFFLMCSCIIGILYILKRKQNNKAAALQRKHSQNNDNNKQPADTQNLVQMISVTPGSDQQKDPQIIENEGESPIVLQKKDNDVESSSEDSDGLYEEVEHDTDVITPKLITNVQTPQQAQELQRDEIALAEESSEEEDNDLDRLYEKKQNNTTAKTLYL